MPLLLITLLISIERRIKYRKAGLLNGIAANIFQKSLSPVSSLDLVGLAKINTEMWTD